MSTHNALISVNRSLLLVLSTLTAACQPVQFRCPDGFVLSPDGRCIGIDAGTMPVGDGGSMIVIDAGTDAASAPDAAVVADAAVEMADAHVELPDAHVEPPDAYVALPDAYVAPDACAWGTWYADHDGDGFGDPSMPVSACGQPAGTVSAPTDCADADATRHPGVVEICNGQDDDCNGATDDGVTYPTFYLDVDGDGYGAGPAVTTFCTLPAGYSVRNGDCDDSRAATNPGATEVCNTIDDNCMNGTDEGLTHTYYADCDGDTFAASSATPLVACPTPPPPACVGSGTVRHWTETAPSSATTADCNDTSATARPDNQWYPDCDGDAFAAATATATTSCNAPTAQACSTAPASTPGGRWTRQAPTSGATDCYDFEAHAYPRSTYTSRAGYLIGTYTSFDYDCDGAGTPVITAFDSGGEVCHIDLVTHACLPASPTWAYRQPVCGASGYLYTCGGSVCSLATSTYDLPLCH